MYEITKGETPTITVSFRLNSAGVDLSAWTIVATVRNDNNVIKQTLTVTKTATEFFSFPIDSSLLAPGSYTLNVRLTNGTIIRNIQDKLIIVKDMGNG